MLRDAWIFLDPPEAIRGLGPSSPPRRVLVRTGVARWAHGKRRNSLGGCASSGRTSRCNGCRACW